MYFRGYLRSYKHCVRVYRIFRPSRLPLFGEETWTGLHRSSSCGLSSRCNDDLSLRYIRSRIRQGSPTIFFIPSLRKKTFICVTFIFKLIRRKTTFYTLARLVRLLRNLLLLNLETIQCGLAALKMKMTCHFTLSLTHILVLL